VQGLTRLTTDMTAVIWSTGNPALGDRSADGARWGMATVTVLSDEARTVAAEIDSGRVIVAEGDLAAAIGWELKAEGLCQGDVCVPVRDRASITCGSGLDLVAVADALDRPATVDAQTGVVAVGEPRQSRRQAMNGQAPSFTFPDLDGEMRSLEDWHGSKKLLVAFASW
jgi:hypothetical protein